MPTSRGGQNAAMETPREDPPTPSDRDDAPPPEPATDADAEADDFDAAIDELGGEDGVSAG